MMSTSGILSASLISAPSSTQLTLVMAARLARTGPATARQHAIGWFTSTSTPNSWATSFRNCWMMNVSEANFWDE